MNLHKKAGLLARLVAGWLCAWGLGGCVGATRLPAKSRGPAGQSFEQKRLDLGFLDESGTRREDVVRRLSSIDTTYANPRVFWGRWSDSKWGYWWMVVGPGGGAGNAKRVWHVHNLLVSFDENGTVQKKMLIEDEPALWRELHAGLTDAPTLQLPQEVPLTGKWCCRVTQLTLNADAMQITRRRGKNRALKISARNIERISHQGAPDKSSNVGTTCHTLHFAERTELGKSFRFCTNPVGIGAMFQYLNEQGAQNLRWE